MRNEQLKSVTVYFSAEEFNSISEEASDHGVTISGYIRARLGMNIRERGAPAGKRHQSRTHELSDNKAKNNLDRGTKQKPSKGVR
jgi:hypothetical protein